MSGLSDGQLRQIVTAAARTILNDPDRHVDRFWERQNERSAAPTIEDLAPTGGLGSNIIAELFAMTQYAWSWIQAHGPNIEDNLIADALVALTVALVKWAKPSGSSVLSKDEQRTVAEEIAKRSIATWQEVSGQTCSSNGGQFVPPAAAAPADEVAAQLPTPRDAESGEP